MYLAVMGWISIAIGIPVLAPIIINAFFRLAPQSIVPEDQRRWYMPVKDGQLFWVVIALASNSLYELPSTTLGFKGWMEGLFITALVTSAILGAIGALWPAAPRADFATSRRKYLQLTISGILVIVVGGLATLVHFTMPSCTCGGPP